MPASFCQGEPRTDRTAAAYPAWIRGHEGTVGDWPAAIQATGFGLRSCSGQQAVASWRLAGPLGGWKPEGQCVLGAALC